MSDKQRHPRKVALALAEKIVSELAPCCRRIAIAGSIRREKPMVGDIEIIYIPNTTQIPDPQDLFGQSKITVNAADLCLARMIQEGRLAKRKNVLGSEVWGAENKFAVAVKTGIPVDLFTANERNWYNYLVCRTGGAVTNTEIAKRAKAKGYRWNPYGSGFVQTFASGEARFVVIRSEEDVFRFVDMLYLPPKERP